MCCWRFGRTPRTTAAMERTMVRNTSAALRAAGTTQAFHHRSTHELAEHPRHLSRGRSGAAAGRRHGASREGTANRRHGPGWCRNAGRHARFASPHAAGGPSASQHHAAAFGGRGLPDGTHRVHGRGGAVHRAHEFRLRLGRPRGNRRRRTAPGAVGALGRRRPKGGRIQPGAARGDRDGCAGWPDHRHPVRLRRFGTRHRLDHGRRAPSIASRGSKRSATASHASCSTWRPKPRPTSPTRRSPAQTSTASTSTASPASNEHRKRFRRNENGAAGISAGGPVSTGIPLYARWLLRPTFWPRVSPLAKRPLARKPFCVCKLPTIAPGTRSEGLCSRPTRRGRCRRSCR